LYGAERTLTTENEKNAEAAMLLKSAPYIFLLMGGGCTRQLQGKLTVMA